MKYSAIYKPLVLAAFLAACGATAMASVKFKPADANASAAASTTAVHETILLVSLEDGSVIMQTINSEADICFKQNSVSATTCLTKGMPVIDQETNNVIGFEMLEEQIDLVGKFD